MKRFLTFLSVLFLALPFALNAQTVSGTVTSEGEPIIGANLLVVGTSNGTITDLDGNYTLSLAAGSHKIEITYTGYTSQTIDVTLAAGETKTVDIVLSEGVGLDEVVVTGNRSKPRTILDSPVPVDNINTEALKQSGQNNIEQMLNYKVPSFNSQNQAISDATAHYDPADLRGLGPSRTLVLVNGKRKNQSAQVYLNRTPGKGEVGIDLKSIPIAAVERVEVLRDGASAQYGSDAIAGVINMILKKNVKYTTVGIKTGVTSEGDGFNFAADLNSSVPVGEGSLNYTFGYYNQKLTNRAGDISDSSDNPNYQQWINENPQGGMIVGQPDMEKLDFFTNFEYPLSDNATFYTFNGYTTRTGRSFAFYRAPYWRGDVAAAEFWTPANLFVGYHPTFETKINDNMNSAGFRFMVGGFNADLSGTYGRNNVDYTVNRSVNRDYLADHGWSPRTFKPGGYTFANTVFNLDLNRTFGTNENVTLGLGAEVKYENFQSHEGDRHSYYKGGSDSFAGIKPEEVVDEKRNSKAGYLTLDVDLTESFLVGGAARVEDFSDFGSNFSWKLNTRYKIGNAGAIRASYSTGFRAPSLHQRYLINSQYISVAGSPDPVLQGTLSNDNPAVKALGVPSLFAETSRNLTAGLTYRLSDYLSASVDFFQIEVDDRVLFSSQITAAAEGDAIDQILKKNGVVGVQFFINAGDTRTRGVDLVLNLNKVPAGAGTFGGVLAANFNKTTIERIAVPSALESGGYDIFDRREQSLITNSRPKSKIILGLHYEIGKFRFGLDNTSFGEVTVTAASGAANDQVHSSKLVTDFSLGWRLHDNAGFSLNINNIFNVYPDELLASTGESSGNRFRYSSIVQQQNFLGTTFSLGFNLKLDKRNRD
jgi:iron complex outermembrane receptor protein